MPYRLLQHLRHLITALGLLVVCMIAAELWLRVRYPLPVATVASQADLIDQRQLIPSATRHHQLRPLSDVGDASSGIRTNSRGLRGPEPELQAANGTLRVLLLGDDAVAGLWLQAKHTLDAQLQRHLKSRLSDPVEVINGGVPGYSPILSLLQYEHGLQELKPDVVVMHVDMSDVADETVHRSSLHQEGPRSVCVHPTVAREGSTGNEFLALVRQSTLLRSLGAGIARDSVAVMDFDRYSWTRPDADNVTAQIRHVMNSIERLRELTVQHGATLIIASAPVPWQVVDPAQIRDLSRRYGVTGNETITSDAPFRILKAWGRLHDVPVCEVVNEFRDMESPARLFRTDAPRLSEYGTALYAKKLARTLLQTTTTAGGHAGPAQRR